MKYIKLLPISICALIYGAGCYYYPPSTIHEADIDALENQDIKVLVEQLPASSQLVGTGSGFVVTDDGYLLTNHHVVKDGNRFLIKAENGCYDAKLVKINEKDDLALLKVDGSFDALPIMDSEKSRLGQEVYTVGFPNISLQGLSPKLTKGSISSTTGMHDDPRFFQVSVPVQPGNSGGALCNEQGNVVGVITAVLVSSSPVVNFQNVNYAVKSSVALEFLSGSPASSKILSASNDPETKPDIGAIVQSQEAAVLILVYQTPEGSMDPSEDSLALDALENWLVLIDGGDLADAWRLTSAHFQASTTKEDFIDKMKNIRRVFGKSVSRQLLNKKNSHGNMSGDFIAGNRMVAQFNSSCENAPKTFETIILNQEKDGQWLVSNYNIR
tara:strand:+ start:1709 stop:2863 length:1155 start_codon:yes stop_codon:yes gene_type:complete